MTFSGWATVGDTAHVLSLVNVLVFAYMVGFQRDIFDPIWKQQGFCVMNPDLEYWTSHDLCLYTDVALSGVLLGIMALLKSQPGMEATFQMLGVTQILGVVGHGIGHGAIARAIRGIDGDVNDSYNGDQSPWEAGDYDSIVSVEFARSHAPYLIFWVLLLKSAMPLQSYPSLLAASAMVIVSQQFFPRNFGFTYVQSVLYLAFSWNEIMTKNKEQKGFEYALYPCLVGLPLGFVGWLESTQCTNFVIRLGGHLIYDAYIPLAMILFYMVCWVRASTTTTQGAATTSKEKVA